MKRNFTLILAMVAAFIFNVSAFAQRQCASHSHLVNQMANDPDMKNRIEAIEQHTESFVKNYNHLKAGATYNIKVVVHVIYNTAQQNISDAQIASQIAVLNKDYRKLNSDISKVPSAFASLATDANIEFSLATVDPNGNATTGITRKSSTKTSWGTNDAMKSSAQGGVDPWDATKYLNMWVCEIGGGILGYAQFPGGSTATDGVVISPGYFGSSDYGTGFYLSAPFDKGRTATHEVGHYLNLRHIWGDANCGNDQVSDTPTAPAANYGCPAYPASGCGGTMMTMNYMDYTDDACMYMFSAGQVARMQALFATGGSRAALVGGTSGGGGTTPAYCASKGNSVTDEWIKQVTFNTINYTSNANAGYADFTATQSTTVNKGASYTLTVYPGWASTAYAEGVAAWIDFNGDKDFADAGEQVMSVAASTTTSKAVTFTIPSTATSGATRMRVSMKYNAIPTSCEAFSYGEVEDYTVTIGTGTADTQAPTVPASLTSSNITSSSCTISWTASTDNVGVTGYEVYRGGVLQSTVTTTSYNATGLTASTAYSFTVKAKDAAGNVSAASTALSVTTAAASTTPTYCASKGGNVTYEWIDLVSLGTINKTSAANAGYANNTTLSTTIKLGTAYTISFSAGFASTAYTEYWKIYIDYNRDGDFVDAGETIHSASSSSAATQTKTFTVPATATVGSTRMRVVMSDASATTSCGNYSYGETEDYTVNITAARDMQLNSSISLYPNPTNSVSTLRLSVEKATDLIVSVYDMQGRAIETTQLSNVEGVVEHQLNVGGLKRGMYFVVVNGNNINLKEKLMVE